MTNKEFKEMIAITRRLSELIKKYEADFAEEVDAPPISVPEDVYDEICDLLNDSYISLFGIS